MSDDGIQIDARNHKRVPSTPERLKHALLALLLSFGLIQLIGFWMFPGVGVGGLYMFSAAHSSVAFVSDLSNLAMFTYMAICGVFGWFKGKYFTDRLRGYLKWWKFW